MTIKTFKGSISTNKVGSDCSFEFEVEDSASQEEIEEAAREAAFENVEWYFEEA